MYLTFVARLSALFLLMAISTTASALVAGGMISTTRQWPASTNGYVDRDHYITVTQEPGNSGFTYWAHQFWFKDGDGGYFGLQQRDGTTKAVNFSIWKATGWTAANGALCGHFSHEGSGVQCSINYNWIQHREYKLRIAREGAGSWAGYIVDMSRGVATKIATITVPGTWGALTETTVEFVEDYAQGGHERASCAAVPKSSAVFHLPTSNNATVFPSSSSTKTYGNCGAIARASCTTEQDCIGLNRPGNPGDSLV